MKIGDVVVCKFPFADALEEGGVYEVRVVLPRTPVMVERCIVADALGMIGLCGTRGVFPERWPAYRFTVVGSVMAGRHQ